MHYIELSGGISIEKVLNQMNNNEKSSTIKATIESWFESTDLDDEENLKKLEDIVYCDDRSVTDTNHGWCKDGEGTLLMRYSTFTRRENGTPNLSCRQTIGNRDRFTYKDIVNGNGLLNWPVGLLSADEIMLAGGQNSSNSDYYLYTGQRYWALSPIMFSGDNSHSFHVHGDGVLSNNFTFNLSGVRPVNSLSSSVLPNLSGIGTETDPYVVN